MMQIRPNIQVLVDAVANEVGFEVGNEQSEQQMIDRISKAMRRYRDEPIALHGHRVEAMFQYIVSSLGKTRAIIQEDAGSIVTSEQDVRPPDYRVILADGTQFFVEVKNRHLKSFNAKIDFKKAYAKSLLNYGAIFNQDVKIAVYWSGMNIWTLVSLTKFSESEGKLTLSFIEAMKRNELSILGDMHIGTTAPLIMRFNTDPSKPRQIDSEGYGQFTMQGVEFYAGGCKIINELEKTFCLYFMMFGKWPSSDPRPIVEDNNLIAFEFQCEPEEAVSGQGFDFVGSLSTMIAGYYNLLTAPEGKVKKLSPIRAPDSLGILIPEDYTGQQLKLWRIVQQPNYE